MKATILIAAFAALMASQAKAETTEYELSVYLHGALKYSAVYSTMDSCIAAGSDYEVWSCNPVKRGV
jgi:hypothetical protein